MQISHSFESDLTSEILMNTFLRSSAGSSESARERWLARQTMLSLMRLVRSEQLLEIRHSVQKLVPSDLLMRSVRGARHKRAAGGHPGQAQFVFGSDD
jgi:hypothetical protein